MFTVRVIPIARGVFKDYLTFFSRNEVTPGSVVSASVRGRTISGLVVESKDVREDKYDLRSADFALKKLSTAPSKRIFTAPFIEAVRDTATWHGVFDGAALSLLASQTILTNVASLEEAPKVDIASDIKPDSLVLQAERGERVRTYRNLAREGFARGDSLLIITPTVIEAETMALELERGIENRVILLTSEIPKKKLIESWNRIITDKEPLLIIGTPFALSVPRSKIGTIIVERESARAYKSLQRPHLDMRRAAERLSRKTGSRLILADFPLRVETRYRVESGHAEELSRSQVRPSGTVTVTIQDIRKKENLKGERRQFSTLSPETKKILSEELAKGGRVIVFAARKGIAPLTVCNDCGTPITDPATGTPMVLHKTAQGTIFLSHRSGATLPSETSCTVCGGWNLVTLGVGIDRVEQELEKAFPKTTIITFTKDTAPTHKTAKKIASQFFTTKSAILIGTERMLPYVTEPVEMAVVSSVDSLLSLSAWRAHEHVLSILFYLRERAINQFVIETRRPDDAVMKALASGNPLEFYRTDIDERERYTYPPFSVFVGLIIRGTRATVDKLRLVISEDFKDVDLVGPLPPTQVTKTEWSARAVIRVPRTEWPDVVLVDRLKKLPMGVDIVVDPDEIV